MNILNYKPPILMICKSYWHEEYAVITEIDSETDTVYVRFFDSNLREVTTLHYVCTDERGARFSISRFGFVFRGYKIIKDEELLLRLLL